MFVACAEPWPSRPWFGTLGSSCMARPMACPTNSRTMGSHLRSSNASFGGFRDRDAENAGRTRLSLCTGLLTGIAMLGCDMVGNPGGAPETG